MGDKYLTSTTVHMVLGRSSSGKSSLVYEILKNFRRIYGEDIGRLVIVYSVWQKIYSNMIDLLPPDITVLKFQGFQRDLFETLQTPVVEGITVLVIDDQSQAILKRTFVSVPFDWGEC